MIGSQRVEEFLALDQILFHWSHGVTSLWAHLRMTANIELASAQKNARRTASWQEPPKEHFESATRTYVRLINTIS